MGGGGVQQQKRQRTSCDFPGGMIFFVVVGPPPPLRFIRLSTLQFKKSEQRILFIEYLTAHGMIREGLKC